jgi:hypothetical protein
MKLATRRTTVNGTQGQAMETLISAQDIRICRAHRWLLRRIWRAGRSPRLVAGQVSSRELQNAHGSDCCLRHEVPRRTRCSNRAVR